MKRIDGRNYDELRTVKITPGYQSFAEGSVCIEVGKTMVVCSATVEDKVPQFLRGTGSGWVTANIHVNAHPQLPAPFGTPYRVEYQAEIRKFSA
jgi:ribonuclease PH